MKTNYTPTTEETLHLLLKNKDSKAFDFIYDNYGSALYGMISKQFQNKNASEDAFVKIFVKIWKEIDQYNPLEGRLFAWMYQIAQKEFNFTS